MVTNNPIPAKGGSLIGATTINWEDVYKGPNVMWRVPRNIRWSDNVVVRQDESAVFYRDGKVLAYLDRPDRYALTTPQRPDPRQPGPGALGRPAGGRGLLPPASHLRRQVRKSPSRTCSATRTSGWSTSASSATTGGASARPTTSSTSSSGRSAPSRPRTSRPACATRWSILVYNTLGKMKEQGMRVTDLASSLTTIEQAVLGAAPQHFGQFGIEMNQLQGLSINLPDEVQKAVDTRSQMGVLGVNYMQYQAGQALTTAAANPSGRRRRDGRGGRRPRRRTRAWATAWPVRCRGCTSRVRPPRARSAGRSSPPGTRFCPGCGNALGARARGARPAPRVRSAANRPRGGQVLPQLRRLDGACRPHGSARSASRRRRAPGSSARTAARRCRVEPDRSPGVTEESPWSSA